MMNKSLSVFYLSISADNLIHICYFRIQFGMNIQSLIFLLTLSILILQVQTRRLVYVEEIFRHGARYPIKSMKNDRSQYAENEKLLGELTSEGKHMQYILGKAMYSKYWAELFAGTQFADKYHPTQLYVKSTNVNRTIESAQAQLQGLLETLPPYELPLSQLNYSLPPFLGARSFLEEPPSNGTSFNVFGSRNRYFHPVPIHTQKQAQVPENEGYKYRANPYDQGDFLIKYDVANCPNQKFWGKENMASNDALRVKNLPPVLDFLKQLGDAVGRQVKYEEAYQYIDDYECQRFQGRPHLDLFASPDTQRISEFVMLTSTIFTFFYTDTQIRASNTQLLQNTLFRMREAKGGRGPRLVLFSAHDTTVLSLSTALRMVEIPCLLDYFVDGAANAETCITAYPQFATNLVLEVWEEEDLSHSVKVLYNGVERKIPICGYKYSCSFAEFEGWAEGMYLDDPNDACGIRQQYTKLYIVIGVLSLFILVFVIIEMSKRVRSKIEKHIEELEEKKGYIENFEEKDHPHALELKPQ